MIEKIRKYRHLLLYFIFGVLTTLVNFGTYVVCYTYIAFTNVESNIIAWILAVLFAFITNKLWVFESKSMELKVLLYELIAFYGCRLMTGLLDVSIMYISVDKIGLNAIIMKIISNLIVIILNYIASKLVIFNKKENC